MVAHGGTSVAGSFIQTLTMVDVATGWTECMPLVTRDGGLVVRAMECAQPVSLGHSRRRFRKPYKKRMRMPSMLDPHLAGIERWLAAEPRLTALAIVGRLAEQRPEWFGPPQHTIVQRLLRSLKRKAAETTISRAVEGAALAGDPGTGAAAAWNGHSATSPVPPTLRVVTQSRTSRKSGLQPSSESNILR